MADVDVKELNETVFQTMTDALKLVQQTAVTKYMRQTESLTAPVDLILLTRRQGRLTRALTLQSDPANITKVESNSSGRWVGTAGVAVGPLPDAIPYARIHEFGGTIVPKVKKVLAFVLSGERPTDSEGWKLARKEGRAVFSMKSVIPARPYLTPAVKDEQAQRSIISLFQKRLPEKVLNATMAALRINFPQQGTA